MYLDFLKDFEYHMKPYDEAYTLLGKSAQLKASLNYRLRRALVGVKLPSMKNYTAYVSGIAEFSANLEGLNDYRLKNAKHTTAKLGVTKVSMSERSM